MKDSDSSHCLREGNEISCQSPLPPGTTALTDRKEQGEKQRKEVVMEREKEGNEREFISRCCILCRIEKESKEH